MKVLVSWLRELVDVPVTVRELADTLQGCGFEVAAVEPLAATAGAPEDGIIDLEVTTNRPDCLNVQGIAREVATKFDLALREPTTSSLDPAEGSRLPLRVIIEDDERCPRYTAAVADVTVGSSPSWLVARLHAAGLRPISNIVDLTNYVMLELGQPMHAFDYVRMAGPDIRVRRARMSEALTTLDGVARTLDPEMLVVADAERAQAVAGVMGGAASEVSAATQTAIFESAYFQPAAVRRTARRLGVTTEASYRFERGGNSQMPVTALERLAMLLPAVGAGRMRPGVIDIYPAPRPPLHVTVRHDRIVGLLGYPIDAVEAERILERLGFALERLDGPSLAWRAKVPAWRVDVLREADLIEEVARHAGYDRVPSTFPPMWTAPAPPDARLERERAAKRVALAAGFSESVTFTFIERAVAARYSADEQLVPIANPLSEKYAVLRPTLLPGLVDSVGHNRRRERRDVQLFELGARFTTDDGESRAVALAWTGPAHTEHWSGDGRGIDFYDMKGVVETLVRALGVEPSFAPARHPALAPGFAAHVLAATPADDRQVIGVVGRLAPGLSEMHGLPGPDEIFVAEVSLDTLAPVATLGDDVRMAPLARHPSIVRDVSVVVPVATPAEALRVTIRAAAPPTLERVHEVARYEGKGLPEGHVSLSFRLVFRAPDRTLTDVEVQHAMDTILAALRAAHDARLR